MTERLDEIVGEMRETAREWEPDSAMATALPALADRILAAAALERAEHRRQLGEALANLSDAEWVEFGDDFGVVDVCGLLASRRARYGKEG